MLGVLCVALGVVRSVWTFPTAIGSVALLGIVVARQRLYSDALLQLFYIGANGYGWWNWNRSRAAAGQVIVERLEMAARWRWAAGCLVATLGWGALMHLFTAPPIRGGMPASRSSAWRRRC